MSWAHRSSSVLAMSVFALTSLGAQAGSCALDSPSNRATVVELYTSEGCSSCPPADRWLSALPGQGVTPQSAVPLAFHVDYWNDLGWPDRFSQARFSARQRAVATRAGAGIVYTPQLLIDGKDFRAADRSELQTKLASVNRETAQAVIQARFDLSAGPRLIGEVTVPDSHDRGDAEVWIAAFENGLTSQVRRGENAGRVLHHDFVVRELVGPLSVGPGGGLRLDQHFRPGSDWNLQRTGIAVFVQRRSNGEVLQAASCGG